MERMPPIESDPSREGNKKRAELLSKLKDYARRAVVAGMITMGTPGLTQIDQITYGHSVSDGATDANINISLSKNSESAEALLSEKKRRIQEIFGDVFDQIMEETNLSLMHRVEESFDIKNKSEELVTGDILCQDGVLTKETLQAIIKETYPRGWVHGEISSITQSLQRGEESNIGETVAICTTPLGNPNTKQQKILMYGGAADYPIDIVVEEILDHELGHANDPKADNESTYEQKMDLALALYQRITSNDRFRSVYVEDLLHIPFKKEEMHARNMNICDEYFAEASMVYLQDPSRLSVEDFLIIDQVVKRGDKDFNPFAASVRRKQILQRAKTHE